MRRTLGSEEWYADASLTSAEHMKEIWVPQLIASSMLLWALNPSNSYRYYVLLRWVCCGVFAYLAFQTFERQRYGWVWILGLTAGIYNPIVPVHLTREIWSVVNVLTIGIAMASLFGRRSIEHAAASDSGNSGTSGANLSQCDVQGRLE
jgi:hypothetical protein